MTVANSSVERRRFGQTALKRVPELFTLEGMADGVEFEYHAVVEQRCERRSTKDNN